MLPRNAVYLLFALVMPAVVWADASTVGLQPQGLNHIGVYGLRQVDPNLDGSDVSVGVISRSGTYIDGKPQNDYRPSVLHESLASARLRFHDEGQLPPGVSTHSTAVCSILFGNDAQAFSEALGSFQYQGVLPAARGEVYEFWHFLMAHVFTHTRPDVDLLTLSVGSGFEDWWTRGIESMCEHYGLPVVASIGNGYAALDPPLYPGASANAIGVGVVSSVNSADTAISLANFALAHPARSSGGTTGGGRSKPDIVAPGNCLVADVNDPNRYEPAGDWSSFSTPLAAGVVGMLIERAKRDEALSAALSANGGNCVIKSIIMNSAVKLPYWHKGALTADDDHTAPLDHVQGAGMIDAAGAYEQLVAGRHGHGDVPAVGWDSNILDRADRGLRLYHLTVEEPNNKIIAVTLNWNRHFKRTYPFEALRDRDANLRLELWAVDPTRTEPDRLIDYSDSPVDNVEHLYVRTDPNYTQYEIVVAFSDLDDPRAVVSTERYALAWSVREVCDRDNLFWHDLNADGVVNEADFVLLLKYWTESIESPQDYQFCDLNDDGVIDVKDFEMLIKNLDRRADWYSKAAAM